MGIWITAAILLALAVLPLGVRIRYNEAGFVLKVIAGPLKITVFPRKKKPKKQKVKQKKKKVAEKAEPAVCEEKSPQPPKTQPEKKEKGGLRKLQKDFLEISTEQEKRIVLVVKMLKNLSNVLFWLLKKKNIVLKVMKSANVDTESKSG